MATSRRKASAIRPTPSRPPVSTGTCGWVPRPPVRSIRTASALPRSSTRTYAGGMMTDWGIHLLDIVQMAFQETEPAAVAGFGGKLYLQDNRETPDTLQVTYEYPNGMIATYENRETNAQSMFKHGYGILFHGTEGTLFVDRAGYQLVPEKDSSLQAVEARSSNDALLDHWQNFIDCIKTRKRPHSDIEIGHRSTTTAILGNMAYRSKLRLDWDAQHETTAQPEARPLLKR